MTGRRTRNPVYRRIHISTTKYFTIMKKVNLSPLLIFLAFSSIMALSSCSNILTAKFEDDSIGSLPDKTLPGSPTGDALSYVPEIETQLKVISSLSHPAEKSLEYTSVPPSANISGHTAWLGFKAKSTDFSKPVTFLWTAQKHFNNGGPNLYIDCSDGSGIVAARIKIMNNGDVILVNDIVTDAGNNVGNIPNDESHTFLVTVDLPNHVYNLSILKGSGNITKNGHSLLMDNVSLYHNPANPSVSFKYDPFFPVPAICD